jgi:hypothetical protein
MNSTSSSRTRLAVLGTISDLHHEPLAYDLACLRSIVTALAPDLLCAEITREAWEGGNLSTAALEVREALAPVVAATDIVLIPVLPTLKQYADFTPATGWHRDLVCAFDRTLQWGQREADRPEAVNGALFGVFCHTICWLTEAMWTAEDRAAWEAQNKAMAENILQAVRRDPSLRVLVTLQCQRLHTLLSRLKAHSDELEIVDYREL